MSNLLVISWRERTSYISMRWWWWYLLCTRTTDLIGFSLKQQVDILLHSMIQSQHYCCVVSGKAANTNFIEFGLIRLEHKPTIYDTGDKGSYHYTTDVVSIFLRIWLFLILIENTCWETVHIECFRCIIDRQARYLWLVMVIIRHKTCTL
jgi:hypothetical protein